MEGCSSDTAFSHLSREVNPVFRQGFGGQKGWRSYCARQEGISSLKLVTDSKVCNLDVSIFSHQQVGWFDVSMDDPLVMNCVENTECPAITNKGQTLQMTGNILHH